MVDIHCHILPGLDDGPATMEESLRMAENAISEGITHIVATPHCSDEFEFHYDRVLELRNELQSAVGSKLEIATGCDFHLSPENLAALRFDASPFCINRKSYLLVEFNEFAIPSLMDQTLHDLRLRGLYPVVTHPERNRILCAHPERVVEWIRLGCCVQITAGALLGSFGSTAKETAWSWIERGMVQIVASDGHNTTRRPLALKHTFSLVAEKFGREIADVLFVKNPRAAYDGAPLPQMPHIQAAPARRKRFFFF